MQKRNLDKLPLDLPTPKVRHRAPDYKGKTSGRVEEMNKTSSLFRKIFVSAIIIIIVLILKGINTDFTQNAVKYARDAVTKDIDIDETLGKLKFVSDYIPDAISVFGKQGSGVDNETKADKGIVPFFSVPAEGKVIANFSDTSHGIDISGTKNQGVYAVADGIIIAAGEDSEGSKYIKINHGDDITSIYEGCSQTAVNIGDDVKKGDKIATMEKDNTGVYTLHFESWVDNKPVDPLKLIDTGK